MHAYVTLCGLSGLRRRATSCLRPPCPRFSVLPMRYRQRFSRRFESADPGRETGAVRCILGRLQVVPFISSTVVSRWINSSRASSKQFNLHKLTATCLYSRRRWGDPRNGCKTAASPLVTLVHSRARSAFVPSRVTRAGKSGRREQRRAQRKRNKKKTLVKENESSNRREERGEERGEEGRSTASRIYSATNKR